MSCPLLPHAPRRRALAMPCRPCRAPAGWSAPQACRRVGLWRKRRRRLLAVCFGACCASLILRAALPGAPSTRGPTTACLTGTPAGKAAALLEPSSPTKRTGNVLDAYHIGSDTGKKGVFEVQW